MSKPCHLGTIEFGYRHDHPLLPVLVGHGVRLDGKYATDYAGVLHGESDILISGDGGVSVAAGDRIRHDIAWCANGIASAE